MAKYVLKLKSESNEVIDKFNANNFDEAYNFFVRRKVMDEKSFRFFIIIPISIMSSGDKLGSYIQKLMTTVLDKEQDEFVVDLALSELTRLKVDLNNFIIKNKIEDDNEKTVKKLLQEKKNGEE